MRKILVALILLSNIVFAQVVPDYAKEARWASFIEDGLMDGDVVLLNVNDHEFLSIYTESESDTKQTAVIVHGLGVHPDWPQVIQPLRVALSERGFNTLSIQMPVLENGMGSDSYIPLLVDADNRINSAVNYLTAQGLEANVLIAHSLGSVMSTHYLAKNANPFKRYVGIGMPKMVVKYLSNIDISVLDLYGDEDIPSVMQGIQEKQRASKHNSNYIQIMVNADHFFNDKDDLLVSEVNAWLK
jgi:alpha/beta superfamily hydrolase